MKRTQHINGRIHRCFSSRFYSLLTQCMPRYCKILLLLRPDQQYNAEVIPRHNDIYETITNYNGMEAFDTSDTQRSIHTNAL
jgi:hypothetical protein